MPTLTWIGKEAVVNHHHEVPYHLLRDVPDLGLDPADVEAVLAAPGQIVPGIGTKVV